MNPLEAHKKLLKILPVRTHVVRDDPPKNGKHPKIRRPVIAFGRRYKSIADAARATGKSRQFIYWRVTKGKECRYA